MHAGVVDQVVVVDHDDQRIVGAGDCVDERWHDDSIVTLRPGHQWARPLAEMSGRRRPIAATSDDQKLAGSESPSSTCSQATGRAALRCPRSEHRRLARTGRCADEQQRDGLGDALVEGVGQPRPRHQPGRRSRRPQPGRRHSGLVITDHGRGIVRRLRFVRCHGPAPIVPRLRTHRRCRPSARPQRLRPGRRISPR